MKKILLLLSLNLGINNYCTDICPNPASLLTNIRVLTVTTGKSSFTVNSPIANSEITFNNQPKSYDGKNLFNVSNTNPGAQSLFIKNANFGANKTSFDIGIEAQSRTGETTFIDAVLCINEPSTFIFAAFPVGRRSCSSEAGLVPLNVTLRGSQGIIKPFFVTASSDLFQFKLLPAGTYSVNICLGNGDPRYGITISFVPFIRLCTKPVDVLTEAIIQKYGE